MVVLLGTLSWMRGEADAEAEQKSAFSLPSFSFAHLKKRLYDRLSALNLALKPIWVSFNFFYMSAHMRHPITEVLFFHYSGYSKHIIGTHCEAGVMLHFRDTKEHQRQSLFPRGSGWNKRCKDKCKAVCKNSTKEAPQSWAPPPGAGGGRLASWRKFSMFEQIFYFILLYSFYSPTSLHSLLWS